MKRMRRILHLVPLVAMLSLVMVVPAIAAPGLTDPGAAKDLATARTATQQYHNVETAIADGYVPTEECVSSPAGGMGFHYVNFGLMDGTIDLAHPEILLYAPSEAGPRLVGIEYVLPIGPPGAPVPSPAPPAPALFGESFEGPMLGHDDGPPHYDLHVWTWQANPDGILAAFNPTVSC